MQFLFSFVSVHSLFPIIIVEFAKFLGSDLIICIKSYKSEKDNSFHFLITLWSVSVAKNKINEITCSVYLLMTSFF